MKKGREKKKQMLVLSGKDFETTSNISNNHKCVKRIKENHV